MWNKRSPKAWCIIYGLFKMIFLNNYVWISKSKLTQTKKKCWYLFEIIIMWQYVHVIIICTFHSKNTKPEGIHFYNYKSIMYHDRNACIKYNTVALYGSMSHSQTWWFSSFPGTSGKNKYVFLVFFPFCRSQGLFVRGWPLLDELVWGVFCI